jgi:hypothetical protein
MTLSGADATTRSTAMMDHGFIEHNTTLQLTVCCRSLR